jgi:hypothetical protein
MASAISRSEPAAEGAESAIAVVLFDGVGSAVAIGSAAGAAVSGGDAAAGAGGAAGAGACAGAEAVVELADAEANRPAAASKTGSHIDEGSPASLSADAAAAIGVDVGVGVALARASGVDASAKVTSVVCWSFLAASSP